MNQGNVISSYESEFFKNQQTKLDLIEKREKTSSQVKVQSDNVSIETLQYNAGSDLIYIWLGVIVLVYLRIFKRRSKIAKGISYLVSFRVITKLAEFIAIRNMINNPGNKLITELIVTIPIFIIVIYNVKKFKNKRRQVYEK